MNVAPEAGAKFLGEVRFREGTSENWLRDWRVSGGAMMRVTKRDKSQSATLFFVAFYGGDDGRRPLLRLVWDDRCRLRGGERIVYEDGLASRLELLDPTLRQRASPIPLNPPVPDGAARADCTRIGLLDNGINYLLPRLAHRLARDEGGALVGSDFWERDNRPFDFGVPEDERDAKLSAFDPPEHGTGLASVFVEDAPPNICLAIYRYSPSDARDEIAAIIDRIAADGVRVIVIASGRNRPWPSFRDAMKAHPEILFIAAAGNDGADLHQRPLYPMAYDMANQLVVGAVDRDGQTWAPSNFATGVVELALPAVDVPGLRFDGTPTSLTGTSYAAARAGALAASIARANPQSDGASLRTMIVQAAREAGPLVDGATRLDEDTLIRLLARFNIQQ